MKNIIMSNQGMAFDSQSGDSFQLNESAQLILTLQIQGLTFEEITTRVVKEFKITYEQALTDVLEFQVHLKILGLGT